MKVKLALEEDFEWIAPIQKSVDLPRWKPNSTSWVIGKSAYIIWQIAGDECELLSVAVMDRNRRKGYAKQLMEHSQNELKKRGVKHFFLEVRESNAAAISFYKKIGYEKISERNGYYSGNETAIVMKLADN